MLLSTSSSDEKVGDRISAFSLQVFFFFVPILAVICIVEGLFFLSGESWSVNKIVKRQQPGEPELIYLRRYLPQHRCLYKYLQVMQRHPELLFLGSSRILQFREALFGESGRQFYNAGCLVNNISDLDPLKESVLADYQPHFVVFGLDLWWFNKKWTSNPKNLSYYLGDPKNELLGERIFAYKEAVDDFFDEPERFLQVFHRKDFISGYPAVGLLAIEKNTGFRNDGSLQYGEYIRRFRANPYYVDNEDPPIIERVLKHVNKFSYCDAVDENKFRKLEEFIDYCLEREIPLIFLVPPFSNEVIRAINNDERHKTFWLDFQNKISELSSSKEVMLVNATSPDVYDLDDRYMHDGIHGSETLMTRIFLELVRGNEILRSVPGVSISKIEKLLQSPETTPIEVNWDVKM